MTKAVRDDVKVGDCGKVTDLHAKAGDNLPSCWDILLDNGKSFYAYEDEFELDERDNKII